MLSDLVRYGTISILIFNTLNISATAQAQVTTDGSLSTTVSAAGNTFTITNGNQAGSNLYHSFSQFSVPTGGSAVFNNATAIGNIFARVTGGSASSIDGSIQANGTANLFLLNPSGIQFGSGASLNIGGSFLASTAEKVLFPGGIEFNATNASTPTLTVNLPTDLQFGQSPAPIQVQGPGHNLSGGPFTVQVSDSSTPSGRPIGVASQLAVPGGKTLALAGGNLDFNGGVISADGGQLQLGAVGTGNTNPVVPLTFNTAGFSLDFSSINNLGNITLTQQALANVSGGLVTPNSGTLQVNGATVSLSDGSLLLSQNSGATPGGNITINADTFQADGVVNVGGVNDGLYLGSGVISETSTLGAGASGNIIFTGRNLILTNAANLFTRTFSFSGGKGGDIQVTASESVNLDGFFVPEDQAAVLLVGYTFGSAPGGNIQVTAPQVIVRNGSALSVATFVAGSSGNLSIDADVVEVSGVKNASVFANISTGTLAFGAGGDLDIQTRQLTVSDGATVNVLNTGIGSSGSLNLNASELIRVQGVGIAVPSEIAANVTLLPAETRALFGLPDLPTGTAGSIVINTPKLEVLEGARIAVLNSGVGDAGILQVNADSILLSDAGLISATASVGNAGSIDITANTIDFRNASGIAASAPSGAGGNISLTVGNFLDARSNSFISATAGGAGLTGGNISITGPNLIHLQASDITASATGTANGGNITLNTGFLVGIGGSDSDIIARAEEGQGGNIDITANGLFGIQFREQLTPSNDINASSDFGVSGTVTITNPALDAAAGLVELPTTLVDPSQQITARCDAAAQGSQFVSTGRGGMPLNPEARVLSDRPWQDLRNPIAADDGGSGDRAEVTRSDTSDLAEVETNSPTLLEATGWQRNAQGQIQLLAQTPTPPTLGHAVTCAKGPSPTFE
jgi:filamentous hemagglutinin family protein